MFKIKNNPTMMMLGIIVFGLLLRCYHLQIPLLEGAIGRQIQTASITKNLVDDDFNIFNLHINRMHLYDNESSPRPHYLMLEFPLYNCLAGFIYKVFGGSLDVCGRSVSILCFLVGLFFFYKLVNLYYGEYTALTSTLLYSIFPVTIIFTKSFQPDTMAICCIIGCLYCFNLWIINDKGTYLSFSLVLAGLAFLLKQPSVYAIIPLVYLSINKFRNNFSSYPRLIILFLIALLPMAMWTYFAYSFHSVYFSVGWGKEVLFYGFPELLSFAWYKRMFEIQIQSYTPFGFTLFLMGIFIKAEGKRRLFFHLWLMSVVAYFLGVPNKSGHDYYQLNMAPVAAFFCGRVLVALYDSVLYRKSYFEFLLPRLIVGGLMGITIFCYSRGGFMTPHSVRSVIEAAKIIDDVSAPNDLIITGYDSGALFYYAQRKGFVLAYRDDESRKLWKIWRRESTEEPSLIDLVNTWREMGAKIFCQTSRTISLFYQEKDFYQCLLDEFPLIAHKEGEYIIFDLRSNTQ